MFIFFFIRLVLAHLIADFLLQTDKVFKIKVKYKWGVLLHGSIVGIISIIFILPYVSQHQIVTYIILLWLIHIFQDKAKIIYNLQMERNNLWTFLLDQLLHIGVIVLVSFSASNIFSNIHPYTYPGPQIFDKIYKNDRIMVFAIWFIVLTYSMSILQEYIKKIIAKDTKEGITFPTLPLKYIEILERGLIGIFIFRGGLWYIPAVLVILYLAFLVRKGKLEVLNFRIIVISSLIIGLLMKITIC
ncbi:MAG: DUF3307 domain-containing protein [Candidatus Firestonebacteria bacterium]